jgi:hypothetical protein
MTSQNINQVIEESLQFTGYTHWNLQLIFSRFIVQNSVSTFRKRETSVTLAFLVSNHHVWLRETKYIF